MKHKYINMDDCLFLTVTHDQDSITTLGVSSCLCLMFYGHQSDKTPFIGMYHWSGFANPHQDHGDDQEEAIRSLVYFLSNKARDQLKINKKDPLYLDSVFMVGGERSQDHLSGTEQEVESIKTYFLRHCRHFFKVTEPMTLTTSNYITSGDQYVDITMEAKKDPCWIIGGGAETEVFSTSPSK